MADQPIPAVVTAGDGRAAKAVYGESKVYLELESRSLVARVVATLQRVPEVSEVWVVGNAERLAKVLSHDDLRRELRKPLHVVPQYRNLFENAWHTYRRILPGAGPAGRDPGPDDADTNVLYLSGDIPLATPQEISAFIQTSLELDCDYVIGLVNEKAMADFYPTAGKPGIQMAYFNLSEGRLRQSNLHFVKPARLGNRHYIEEMYEHRYQKEFGNILSLAWRIARSESGGLRIVFYYMILHLAGMADRSRWRRLADWLRHRLPMARVEQCISTLLRTRFRFGVTNVGGCAVDIDNEKDYDTVASRFSEWQGQQRQRAETLHGSLLPAPPEDPPPELLLEEKAP